MPNQVPNQQAVDRESIFMTENYGGLNLESSPMNMPLTDSPSVTNVVIDPSGKVKKRFGSKVLADFMEYTDIHIPFRLSNGRLIHIITDKYAIKVLEDGYGVTTPLYSTSACLTPYPVTTLQSSYTPKRTHLMTREDNTTKFHIFSSTSVPITLTVTEVPSTFVSATHNVVPKSNSIFTGNFDVSVPENAYFTFEGSSWRKGTAYTGGYLHLVDETGIADGTVGLAVVFSWSWEADAQWRTKGHWQHDFLKFNVDLGTDVNIELSPTMKVSLANDFTLAKNYLYSMYNISTIWSNSYPALLARDISNDATTQTWFTSHPQPQLQATPAVHWFPTFGSVIQAGKQMPSGYVVGDTTFLSVGTTHICFGGNYYLDTAYTVPFQPYPATLLRIMGVYIGGKGGCKGNEMVLFNSDNTVIPMTISGVQSTGNWYNGYYSTGAGQVTPATSASTQTCLFYGFFGGSVIGCRTLDNKLAFVPASVPTGGSTTGTYPTKQGALSLNFVGLYPWINMFYHDFFNVSTMFQDRVVLAGFTLSPNTVLFGNVGNETQMQKSIRYSNFEVAWADNTLATSPLEVRLNMSSDEQIQDMIQWHDSLFIGTTKQLYRIHGGQNVAITPTNYFVDTVSNVACAYRSMVLTNDGVVFLSDSGVYRVGVDNTSGQFKVINIGIKVRKAIREGLDKGRLNAGLGRMAYDSVNDVLYVLVGDKTSLTPRRCFVYFADRQSWVEWTTASGYFPATSVTCYDGRVFFTMSETTEVETLNLIENEGSVKLFKDSSNYMYVEVGGVVTPIYQSLGGVSTTHQLDTWSAGAYTAYAAETLSGVNSLLWVSSTQVILWTLNANWVRASTLAAYSKGSAQALQYETDFGVDVDVPRITTTIDGVKQQASLVEFNIKDSFLDLVKTSVIDDNLANVQIKLPVPRVSLTKAASPLGTKAHFSLETPTTGTGIKPIPVGFLGYKGVTNTTDATTGVEGTDYVTTKDSAIITTNTFQGATDVVQVEVLAETDLSPLYIKNVTTESYIPLTSLTYNVAATSKNYHAKCTAGDVYDGKTVTYGLAYPSWWLSPAFTRNNIKNLKRMSHFYAVFENSVPIQTNATLAPSWVTAPKMNLAIVQNGSRTGQSSTAVTDESDPFDILSTSDAGLDYYRVVYPIEGNFISFQAFVYSFDDGNWELVGYQLEADTSGKTSRKPYD
jgi:hypothetical protein